MRGTNHSRSRCLLDALLPRGGYVTHPHVAPTADTSRFPRPQLLNGESEHSPVYGFYSLWNARISTTRSQPAIPAFRVRSIASPT